MKWLPSRALVPAFCYLLLAGSAHSEQSWSQDSDEAFRSRILVHHPVGSNGQLLRNQLAEWGFQSKYSKCKTDPNLPTCSDPRPKNQESYKAYVGGLFDRCTALIVWDADEHDNIIKYEILGIHCGLMLMEKR